jgi:hypothetical protein
MRSLNVRTVKDVRFGCLTMEDLSRYVPSNDDCHSFPVSHCRLDAVEGLNFFDPSAILSDIDPQPAESFEPEAASQIRTETTEMGKA